MINDNLKIKYLSQSFNEKQMKVSQEIKSKIFNIVKTPDEQKMIDNPEISKILKRMEGSQQMQNRMSQKTFGIKPEQFEAIDIKYSTTDAKISDTLDENIDEPDKKNVKSRNFQRDFEISKFIILDETSYFCMGWNVIDLICSIISSYLYGWIAVFGLIDAHGNTSFGAIYADYTFFVIFSITILITFVTAYTP